MTVETRDYLQGFARRIIRSAGARVAVGDPADLVDLVALRDDLDRAIVEAARAMHDSGHYSYGDIARELGITRQSAHERFGRTRPRRAG